MPRTLNAGTLDCWPADTIVPTEPSATPIAPSPVLTLTRAPVVRAGVQ